MGDPHGHRNRAGVEGVPMTDQQSDLEATGLLLETLQDLTGNDKSPLDVAWVGSRDGEYAITWDDFAAISNVTYDSGYGWQEVASDLVVVGVGWWLERSEYDGSERWDFQTQPQRHPSPKPFTIAVNSSTGWNRLDALNAEADHAI